VLKELDARLFLLKTRESQRTSKLTGMEIEEALRRLAEWFGGKDSSVYGIASQVNKHFNQEQRRVLFGWSVDIEESMW
jgi:hypothetical protein